MLQDLSAQTSPPSQSCSQLHSRQQSQPQAQSALPTSPQAPMSVPVSSKAATAHKISLKALMCAVFGLLLAAAGFLPWIHLNWILSEQSVSFISFLDFSRTYANLISDYSSYINLSCSVITSIIVIAVWLLIAVFFVINLIRVLKGRDSLRSPFVLMAIFCAVIIADIYVLDALFSLEQGTPTLLANYIAPTFWPFLVFVLSIVGASLSGKKAKM